MTALSRLLLAAFVILSAGCLVDVPGVGTFNCEQNGTVISCVQVEMHRGASR